MYNGNSQYPQQPGWQGQMRGNVPQGQQMPQGFVPQNVYPPQQGYPGYPPQQPYGQPIPPQGYPQGGQPGMYPQQPGQPQANPQGYPQGNGMMPPSGQPMQQGGQPVPLQGYPQRGMQQGMPMNQPMTGYGAPQRFTQQQPYGQPGYNQPPYYNPNMQPPYPQMPEQHPANLLAKLGGLPWMQIALFGVLPVLFLAGMFVASLGFLKILFLVGALAGVTMLWVKPVVGANLRLLLTAGYAVMAVIVLISLLSGSMAPNDATNSSAGNQAASQQAVSANTSADWGEVPATLGAMEDVDTVDVSASGTDAATSAMDTGEAIRQLQSFFHSWSVNRTDEMVALSAPSWQSSVEDPKKALFAILANRTVLEHTVVSTTGTDADSTRTSTVDAVIDKGNGRAPVKYRFQVILLKDNGIWYVDPRSLTSVEAVEEAVQATATPDPAASATAAPTGISGNTELYYNPDGGTKYHIDPKCPDVAARFTPLAGHFTYSQINDSKYVKLKRCARCNAPVRPAN